MERDEKWYPTRECPWPLFLIYINSLPLQITDGLLVQYADGATLACSGSTLSVTADALNLQLKLVCNWIQNSNTSLDYT